MRTDVALAGHANGAAIGSGLAELRRSHPTGSAETTPRTGSDVATMCADALSRAPASAARRRCAVLADGPNGPPVPALT